MASSSSAAPIAAMAAAPPMVASARLSELLEYVRMEGEALSGMVEASRRENGEYAGQAEMHVQEMATLREQLAFLNSEHRLAKQSYEERLAELKRQLDSLRAANGTGPPIPNIASATTNHFGALMGHPAGMFGQGSGNGSSGAANGQASTSASRPEDRDRDMMAVDRERDHRDSLRDHREHSAAASSAGVKRPRPMHEDSHMHGAEGGSNGSASAIGQPPSAKPRLGGLPGEAGPGAVESRTAAGSAAFPPRPPSRTYHPSSPHHHPSASSQAPGRPSSAAAHHQQPGQEPSVLQQAPAASASEAKRSSLGGAEQAQSQTASSATPAPAPIPANTGVAVPAQRQKREDWDVTYNKELDKKLEVSLVHTFVHDSVVCCVRLSPDGKLLATGCNRNTTLYDTKTGQRKLQLVDPAVEKPDNYIRSVAFSPDGRTIATGSEDHQVRLWDIAFGKMKAVFSGHRQEIYSLAFTPDGTRVISGSGDRSAIVWNVETGAKEKQLTIEEPPRYQKPGDPHDAGVTSVAVSTDGKYLVAGSLDHNVRIWEISSGRLLDKLKGHKDSVYSVAFIPGGRQILTGSLDKTLKIWEIGALLDAVDKGEAIDPNVSRCRPLQTLSGHKDFVLSVAATPDGQYVISGSKDRAVNFWSPKDDTTQFVLHGHKNSVISIAMSETNGLLATGSGDWQARIFRIDGLGPAKAQPQAAIAPAPAPIPASAAPAESQSRPRSPTVPKQEDTSSSTVPPATTAVANGTGSSNGDKPVSAGAPAAATAASAASAPAGGEPSTAPSKSGSTASSSSAAAAAATSKAASASAEQSPAP